MTQTIATATVYTSPAVSIAERTYVELPTVPTMRGVIDQQAGLYWVLDRRTRKITAAGSRAISTATLDELVAVLVAEMTP